MRDFVYDDSELQKMIAELDPKQRAKALRGALRREANRMRKAAINNLRSSIRSDADLEKGVRAVVFKRQVGYRVTVGTKLSTKPGKSKGYHKNRQGLEKPVLIWAEDGTKWRRVKRKYMVKIKGRYITLGKDRGFMKRYGFMAKTAAQERATSTENLHKAIIENIQKTAKKHGCK